MDTPNSEKIFTLEELARYNGQNNQPAYVAVDSNVYDVTNIFQEGYHYSHIAGQDLTAAFATQHIKDQIAKYPIVGKLK